MEVSLTNYVENLDYTTLLKIHTPWRAAARCTWATSHPVNGFVSDQLTDAYELIELNMYTIGVRTFV